MLTALKSARVLLTVLLAVWIEGAISFPVRHHKRPRHDSLEVSTSGTKSRFVGFFFFRNTVIDSVGEYLVTCNRITFFNYKINVIVGRVATWPISSISNELQ